MVAARSRLRAHAPAYAALAALFLFSITHFARDAFDRIDAVRHAAERVRDPFYLGDANWGAVGLQPEAEAAGLKYGNVVLAVNGRPVDGFFVYVNAGHNPPMLFRQVNGGQEVQRLDTGGPVIGLMEECCYRQGQVTLEAGDVLVAYTDGVSEAMNGSDIEWGEERLMEAVWPNRDTPACGLIDRMIASADAFVAGAPQYDDMTLVIVRVM